jgi:hypothetical protein
VLSRVGCLIIGVAAGGRVWLWTAKTLENLGFSFAPAFAAFIPDLLGWIAAAVAGVVWLGPRRPQVMRNQVTPLLVGILSAFVGLMAVELTLSILSLQIR